MMKLGVIGGSGLYEIAGFESVEEVKVNTPFGAPSDVYKSGLINGTEVVFLPRHGMGHKLLPTELNHKANIFGMKKLGVTHVVSISAVGSLKEELVPRDVVIVDQYFDRTKRGLDQTFFGRGVVAHIAFAHPVCPELSQIAYEAACAVVDRSDGAAENTIHQGGSYLNMEGPAFSTKAESNIYRSWGLDVIGMTNVAEAKLAREAEICYCTVAMVTDYDCWHPDHDSVTVELIIGNLQANAKLAQDIILEIVAMREKLQRACDCEDALKYAIITAPDAIPADVKQQLQPIIGKYYPQTD